MSKFIPLTNGMQAIVDDDDFADLSMFKWMAVNYRKQRPWYARRYVSPNSKLILMHRQVLGDNCPANVDHIDGNGLNNQKANLRAATASQNAANMIRRRNATSRFRGVTWDAYRKKWVAKITFERKCRYLGLFPDERMAALAYDAAAIKFFGEYARPNF